MSNILIATNLLTTLLQQGLSISSLLTQAKTEGRDDLTDAELAQVQSAYDAANNKLSQDIAAQTPAG